MSISSQRRRTIACALPLLPILDELEAVIPDIAQASFQTLSGRGVEPLGIVEHGGVCLLHDSHHVEDGDDVGHRLPVSFVLAPVADPRATAPHRHVAEFCASMSCRVDWP